MLHFKTIAAAWDQFFFTQRPTYNLALFRIIWGTLIFISVLSEIGNVQDFYGPAGLISLAEVKSRFPQVAISLFYYLPDSRMSAYGIYFFTLFSLLMMTVGLKTRFFLFSSLICLVSLHMRNVWLISGMDVLVRCIFIIFIWSPCFNVLSLDSLLARKRGKPLPVNASQWTWRLIQIQLSIVYLWTFWAKFKGDNWFDGSAVYYATRLETMRNFTIPWILDSSPLLMFATWSTLFIEFALGSLVWFKRLRTPIVILGIALHLGIEITMTIPFFEWVMMVLLMNYFNPEEYVELYEKCQKWFKLKTSLGEGLIKS